MTHPRPLSYEPDQVSMGRMLRTSSVLQRHCEGEAEKIRGWIRLGSPVRSGAYRRSLKITGRRTTARVGAAIESTDPAAFALEFGDEDQPARKPMRRGALNGGYDLRGPDIA